MAYRSSAGDLGYQDELPPIRGERWDRDRFERMRGLGRGPGSSGRDEHDHYRFQERDRFPGGRREVDIHEDYDRRGPRVMERESFREDERFAPRRRTEIFDEPTPSEVANRALAPYRRKSIVEKDIDISVRRPARPQYIRRQSSLDTFDRRPLPKYGEMERFDRMERERDDYKLPPNVPIPLPIRERRRSPSRGFREEDFEEIRYKDFDREREPRREEYREVEIKREKSRHRRSRSQAAKSHAATSVRSSSSSSFETVDVPARANFGRRGKTRLPKRLVKKQAIVELGYPYNEEDDFFIVTRALEKEHIDEIIKISENYGEEKTTYIYEDKKTETHEPPPPPPSFFAQAPPPPPPPESVYAPAPPPPASVRYAETMRSASPPRHEIYEERIEESNHIGGPLTVLVPEDRHRHRSERDIREEIRSLESERRMLKYEREGDYEIIERREPRREVLRVEKDRRGKLALVRSAH
ncbi:hypothetical protein BDV96DRAFT_648401 [Lophiotrema nucula]|uniref:DUF8035 domain-containing protein n=1 Tax=Lophiotrema nucula TaxID=690887 RepID=A0A6A5Z367_9PLEO|nr:hypothetical protein BDV96DRAFT_648401 [Lophiotrema nucula]